MRRPGFLLLVCVLLLSAGSCARRSRVIPRNELADIYVEMFLADQWLKDHPEARRSADTMAFYAPIFQRYGYRFEDYDASVNHYLKDPARFSKVLTAASEKLKKRAQVLEREEDRIKALEAFEQRLKGYRHHDFGLEALMRDSLACWPLGDSLRRIRQRPSPLVDSLVESRADSLLLSTPLIPLRDAARKSRVRPDQEP